MPLLFTKILRNAEYIIKECGVRNDHGENKKKTIDLKLLWTKINKILNI